MHNYMNYYSYAYFQLLAGQSLQKIFSFNGSQITVDIPENSAEVNETWSITPITQNQVSDLTFSLIQVNTLCLWGKIITHK